MYALLLLIALAAPGTAQISQSTFQRHAIAVDFPNGASWGYGLPTLADYDGDGDLDFSVSNLTRGLYWFEHRGPDDWVRRKVGDVALRQLGATAFDVDKDSRPDLVIGGYWYRNPGNPREAEFERIEYDPDIADIHDIAIGDINGDGRDDIVVLGDRSGCFWYAIPEDPIGDKVWRRTTVTMDVLVKRDWIHSGIFPKGVGDLDSDGDMDLVVTDRWYENNGDGSEWTMHRSCSAAGARMGSRREAGSSTLMKTATPISSPPTATNRTPRSPGSKTAEKSHRSSRRTTLGQLGARHPRIVPLTRGGRLRSRRRSRHHDRRARGPNHSPGRPPGHASSSSRILAISNSSKGSSTTTAWEATTSSSVTWTATATPISPPKSGYVGKTTPTADAFMPTTSRTAHARVP